MKDTRNKRAIRLRMPVAAVASLALVVGMCPTAALAAPPTTTNADGSASAAGQVIGLAYAAAEGSPEILGMDNPEYRSNDNMDMQANLFGTEANENPDPFYYNYLNGKTPALISNTRGAGPMSALLAYGSSDSTNALWDLLPDVIIGTGTDSIPENEATFYDTDDYARAVEKANDLDANSYHPIGVTYDRIDLNHMIATMYREAAAADKAVADSNGAKSLRYGSATDIAKQYESFIVGSKGAVIKAIDAGTVQKKTIAVVTGYDADAGTYQLTSPGHQEGTASTNRYLESVQGLVNNLYDITSNEEKTQGTPGRGGQVTTTYYKTVDASELASCDLVIVNGTASEDLLNQLNSDGLQTKAYWSTNRTNGTSFMTTVNSVENAMNVAEILPAVYPEVLDQSSMVTYFYDTFYHIEDGSLGAMIDQYMDGVRNVATNDSSNYTNWTADDVSDYKLTEVEGILDSGVEYLSALTNAGVSYDATMKPTENILDANASLGATEVRQTTQSTDEGAVTTITLGGETLTEGVDYTVSYEDADGNALAEKPTAAGTYQRVITGVGDESTLKIAVPYIVPSDVTEATDHAADIDWLAESGITTGFPDGTFRPYENVARCDMAAFLYRLAGSPYFDETTAENPFTDVDEGTDHYKEILWLASTGITKGWDNGDGTAEFRPLANIARQDMAAFLCRLAAYEGDASAQAATAADAAFDADDSFLAAAGGRTATDAHQAEVLWLRTAGITEGFHVGSATTFSGLENITRCDMAALLHRTDTILASTEA